MWSLGRGTCATSPKTFRYHCTCTQATDQIRSMWLDTAEGRSASFQSDSYSLASRSDRCNGWWRYFSTPILRGERLPECLTPNPRLTLVRTEGQTKSCAGRGYDAAGHCGSQRHHRPLRGRARLCDGTRVCSAECVGWDQGHAQDGREDVHGGGPRPAWFSFFDFAVGIINCCEWEEETLICFDFVTSTCEFMYVNNQ